MPNSAIIGGAGTSVPLLLPEVDELVEDEDEVELDVEVEDDVEVELDVHRTDDGWRRRYKCSDRLILSFLYKVTDLMGSPGVHYKL